MKDYQKMNRSALSVAFDTLGILNLVAAAGFMSVFIWSLESTTQAFALRAFSATFVIMLLFFALGRVMELFELVQTQPVIERRGHNTNAEDAGTALDPTPQPAQLQLVEASETGTSKSRRDAA